MAVAILGMTAGPANGQTPQIQGGADAPAPAVADRQLFAMIYPPGPKWRQEKPFREQIAIREHFGYMKSLFAEGRIFSAGGMGAEHGLVLLHAGGQAEADAILAADPMIQAGGFQGVVRPYSPTFLSDRPLTATGN